MILVLKQIYKNRYKCSKFYSTKRQCSHFFLDIVQQFLLLSDWLTVQHIWNRNRIYMLVAAILGDFIETIFFAMTINMQQDKSNIVTFVWVICMALACNKFRAKCIF